MKNNLLVSKLFIDAALTVLGIYAFGKDGVGAKVVGAAIVTAGTVGAYCTVKEMIETSSSQDEHGVF